MNENYTYIIASMPVLRSDFQTVQESVLPTLEWIADQLDEKDRLLYDLVREGFDPKNLDEDFYRRASVCRNDFVRGFFANDLALRNEKVRYLNMELGRPADEDIVASPFGEEAVSPGQSLFKDKDILTREKDIDRWLWHAAEELVLHKYFTLDNVLSLVVKLSIIQRWLSLDGEQGQLLLRRFIAQVRGSYGELEFENNN